MRRFVRDNATDAVALTSLSTSIMYTVISDTITYSYYTDKSINVAHTMSRHFCNGQSLSLLFHFSIVCACASGQNSDLVCPTSMFLILAYIKTPNFWLPEMV